MNPFIHFKKFLYENIKEEFISDLYNKWNASNRYYHNIDHLTDIIKNIEKDSFFEFLNIYEKRALLLAAFFHDAIYEPRKIDNEDSSIKYFKLAYKHQDDTKTINVVSDLIEITKYRKKPTEKLQKIFWDADNIGFVRGYDNLLKNESLIRKEFLYLPIIEYKEKRIKFLETCIGLFNKKVDKDINKLINFIKIKLN